MNEVMKSMLKSTLLPLLWISHFLTPSAVAAMNSQPARPGVCQNKELIKAISVIRAACKDTVCNPQMLSEIDTSVDKATLLYSLRSSELNPIHIFFPLGETRLGQAFDWPTIKRDQLGSIRFMNNPSNTLIFVLGRASTLGSVDKNILISEQRALGVMSYIRGTLGVNCKSFHAAWLGETIFQWSASDASFMNILPRDYRESSMVLNQSVHVFVFPCADLIP